MLSPLLCGTTLTFMALNGVGLTVFNQFPFRNLQVLAPERFSELRHNVEILNFSIFY